MGGLDLNSSISGCARLGSGVAPPLGVVEKEMAVLIVLVRSVSSTLVSGMALGVLHAGWNISLDIEPHFANALTVT